MKVTTIISARSLCFTLVAAILMPTHSSAENNASHALITGNDISFDAGADNHFSLYAAELPSTLRRMPEIPQDTGLFISEIKTGLFYVTDGVYQSAFLATDDGVIVFDAPPSIAYRLPEAIARYAPNNPIQYLVYSHNHTDHIGGSNAFSDVKGLKIIAHKAVAESLVATGRSDILAPTVTFTTPYQFSLGGAVVELAPTKFHAEDVDTIIYLPQHEFIMAVDTITPGEVPFMNFGATSDVNAYMAFFDTVLSYEFDYILSGHVSVLGERNDVIKARSYAHDVRRTAGKGMASFQDLFNQTLEALEFKNANLAYRATIESIRRDCASEIIDRWKEELSVVDVWADSHCETIILYNIMH